MSSIVDLGELWYEFHRIFYGYKWSREEVRKLTRSERKRWVSVIEEERKQTGGIFGGGG